MNQSTYPPGLQPLAQMLSKLRLERGNPSYKTIGTSLGISHATVNCVCIGRTNARWAIVEAIATYLEADIPEVKRLWLEAQTSGSPRPPRLRSIHISLSEPQLFDLFMGRPTRIQVGAVAVILQAYGRARDGARNNARVEDSQ